MLCLMPVITELTSALVAAERIFKLLDEDEEISDETNIEIYPNGEINYSHGRINGMAKTTKYGFIHDASTDYGSSGSPIFLEGTTRVIGIHKGGNKEAKIKSGDFIWPIVNFFQTYSNNKIKSLNIDKIYLENKENTINDINANNVAQLNKNNSSNNMDVPLHNHLHPLKSLIKPRKSICKIIVSSNKLASGFFNLSSRR